MFGTMIRLENLCRLELINFLVNVKEMEKMENLPSLEQVTHLKLTYFSVIGGFDAIGLCRTFSRLFPELEELTLLVLFFEDGEAVRQCYGQYWPHLKEFQFTVHRQPNVRAAL